MPGHISSRLKTKEGGNSAPAHDPRKRKSTPEPQEGPRIPPKPRKDPYQDMSVDRLINHQNLARGGFTPEHLSQKRIREPQEPSIEGLPVIESDPLFEDMEMETDEPMLNPDVQ